MASLRSITQINPDSIVYDERTKQYHDTANRYRMVKKSVAEAVQTNISSGAPTRGNENFVSQTAFDAFRKDIYKHISETARLTKIGLDELKNSLDYQTKETERLQRIVNRTDEELQEQNKIEKIDDSQEKSGRKNRRGMSISSFLGLGAGGLLGAFLTASMMLSPQQHQQIGETIDQSLNAITLMIDSINRINNLIQPFVNLIQGIREAANNPETPGGLGSTAGSHGGGAGHEGMGLEPESPAPAPAIPQNPSPTTSPSPVTPQTTPPPSPSSARPATSTPSEVAIPPATSPATREPQITPQGGMGTPERVEENQNDPSAPHRAISSILLNNEENQRVNSMIRDPNTNETTLRDTIVNMIANRLQGRDINALAEDIAIRIGSSPTIHNSAEVARNIITSINDGVGFNEAARRLYDTFYHQDVTGGAIPSSSTISIRSEALRLRLNRRTRQEETSVNPINGRETQRIAGTFPTTGTTRVSMLPPIVGNLPQNNGGQQPVARQTTTPTAIAPPIQTTNLDPTFAAFRASMGLAIA